MKYRYCPTRPISLIFILAVFALLLTGSPSTILAVPTYYHYLNKKGRNVYVDDLAKVPPKYRKKTKTIDLSHISLNPELGKEISNQVEKDYQRYQRLIEQAKNSEQSEWPDCQTLRENTSSNWLKQLWHEHSYLVTIAGFLLLLLLTTPYIIKRIEPERWIRVLLFVFPLMGALAALSYSMVKTQQSYRELHSHLAPCFDWEEEGEAAPAHHPLQNIQELRLLLKQIEDNQEKKTQELP